MASKVFPNRLSSSPFILALVFLLVALGCRQSKTIPAEIVGDSMAPWLCGTHLSQRCPQCENAFVCRTGPDLKSVQCAYCGSQFPAQNTALPADRVQVTPDQLPQRWDIIAFEQNGSPMIKRVVGLPGETVSISGGNVIIDQSVVVKPDVVLAQTRQLVFDSRHQNLALFGEFANYEFATNHWENEKGTLVHRRRATCDQTCDWIHYRHRRNYPHLNKPDDEAAPPQWPTIQDNNHYNQNVGRKLNDVHELQIRLDLTVDSGSTFKIQIRRPQGTAIFTFRVASSGHRFRVEFFDGKSVATAEGISKVAGEGPFEVALLFSTIDGRMRAAVDGKVLIDQIDRFEGPALHWKSSAPQLKFGFTATSWGNVIRCRVWRDIHYFAELGPPKFKLPLTLGREDYFVLGDNVAVSRDSRHFGPINKVIGVVKH